MGRPASVANGRTPIDGNGGQGRNRTSDTRIFSPLLYQLSYLAVRSGARGAPSGRLLDRPGPACVKVAAAKVVSFAGARTQAPRRDFDAAGTCARRNECAWRTAIGIRSGG